MEMKCNVCGKELEIKPGFQCEHREEYPVAIALVEYNEGNFLGYNLTSITTMEEYNKHKMLNIFQLETPGILTIEPIYQANRNKDFMVFSYDLGEDGGMQ